MSLTGRAMISSPIRSDAASNGGDMGQAREAHTPNQESPPLLQHVGSQEKADVIGDHPAVFFQGEVPSVEQVELDVLKIPLVGVRPLFREDRVVLAPDDQRRRLALTEVRLP